MNSSRPPGILAGAAAASGGEMAMNDPTLPDHATRPAPDLAWAFGLWSFGSAIATAVGAGLALQFFPEAAFNRNPLGQFEWNLIGFAGTIGATLGLVQWLMLCHLLKHRPRKDRLALHLWGPMTAIGITGMIVPLWGLTADRLVAAPEMVLFPIFPGILYLGVSQWLLLRELVTVSFLWAVATILGASLGAVVGLVTALEVLPTSVEITWGFLTGGSIGFLQGFALAMTLSSQSRAGRVAD